MEKPRCEKCEAEGLRYTVDQPMGGMTTLMAYSPGYWDKDGIYHANRNPNITTYTYKCSNGHSWSESK